MEDRFLRAFWEKVRGQKLSQVALSRLLGVSQPQLSRVRAGKRGAGVRFLRAALAVWPDLAGALLPDEGVQG